MVFALAGNVVSAIGKLGWPSAAAITAIVIVLDIWFIWRHRDTVLLHWLLFGIVAGWLELIADWWVVASTGTLVYPGPEPRIWASPAYMPFAWATMLAQVGVIALWMRQRLPLLAATVLTALIAAGYIPLYESLAKWANWWHYVDTPMLLNAPFYVIAGEFITALPLAPMVPALAQGRLRWTVGLAVALGIWMVPAFMIGYRLFGACTGALIQCCR